MCCHRILHTYTNVCIHHSDTLKHAISTLFSYPHWIAMHTVPQQLYLTNTALHIFSAQNVSNDSSTTSSSYYFFLLYKIILVCTSVFMCFLLVICTRFFLFFVDHPVCHKLQQKEWLNKKTSCNISITEVTHTHLQHDNFLAWIKHRNTNNNHSLTNLQRLNQFICMYTHIWFTIILTGIINIQWPNKTTWTCHFDHKSI